LTVVHFGVQDGKTASATETGYFNIRPLKITVVDIVPGQVGTFGVDAGKPDLVVAALSVTSWTPSSITYSYTIRNIGTSPANLDGPTSLNSDNVSVQAYLSPDTDYSHGTVAAGGTILGNSPLGFLDPGETFTGSFTSSASVDPSATQYLVLKVDAGNVVDESDETNNTGAAPIVAEPAPDLIVTSLAVTGWTSTSISYAYTVKNVGTAAVDLVGPNPPQTSVSVQAYLSADTVYESFGDVAAGGTVLTSTPTILKSGDTFSGSFSASVAVWSTPPRFLLLKVDAGKVVSELDENNNIAAVSF
jgi:hypothetical protein